MRPTRSQVIKFLKEGQHKLGKAELVTALQKLDAHDFTQLKLLREIEQLRASSQHEEDQKSNVDRHKDDIVTLVRGDPRKIEQLKSQLAAEQDKVFYLCFIFLSAVILLVSLRQANLF